MKNKNGLSLIALLVILAAVSVAVAFLIPVITKKHMQIDINAPDNYNGGYFICYKDENNVLHQKRVDISNGAATIDSSETKDNISNCTFKIPSAKEYKVVTIGGGGGGAMPKVEVNTDNLISEKKITFSEERTVLNDPFASYDLNLTKNAFNNFGNNVTMEIKISAGGGASSNSWTDTSGQVRYAKGGNSHDYTWSGPAKFGNIYNYKNGTIAKYTPCSKTSSIKTNDAGNGYLKIYNGTNTLLTDIIVYGGKSAVCDSVNLGQAINACYHYTADNSYGNAYSKINGTVTLQSGACVSPSDIIGSSSSSSPSTSESSSTVTTDSSSGRSRPDETRIHGRSDTSVSSSSVTVDLSNVAKDGAITSQSPIIALKFVPLGLYTSYSTVPFSLATYLKNTKITATIASAGQSGGVAVRTVPYIAKGDVTTITIPKTDIGEGGAGSTSAGNAGANGTPTTFKIVTNSMNITLKGEGGLGGKTKEIREYTAENETDFIDEIKFAGENGMQTSVNLPESLSLPAFAKGIGATCDSGKTVGENAAYMGYGGAGGCINIAKVEKYAGYRIEMAYTNIIKHTLQINSSGVPEYVKTPSVTPSVGSGTKGAGGAVIISW